MATLKSLCILILIVLATLTTIVIVRTIALTSQRAAITPCKQTDLDFIEIGKGSTRLKRFQNALKFQTVSTEQGVSEKEELSRFVKFIMSEFPTIHSSSLVQWEIIANYSLLYTVKGTNVNLKPYLLMAHLDVVPADPTNWQSPPFTANLLDDYVYGRGTIDFKQGVMGLLEALEFYIHRGQQPQRGFYVALGHDEEIGGEEGAKSISDALWSRGVTQLEFILDEGLTLTNRIIPGVDQQAALVGTSEKGSVTVELKVTGKAGHSSMPPPQSTIGILANAVARLERSPQPSMLGYGPEKETFEHLAPYMKLPFRIVMSNLWLFKPVISWVMSRKETTNAVIRTVTAVTMFNAGIKINVNAPEATAYVNHRIHPAQTVKDVVDYDREVINDERVKVRVVTSMEAHPIAATGPEDVGYNTVKTSIQQIWNETLVAPGTMIGNTDTRHYLLMTHNVYRFSPTIMFPTDVTRFHGDNERISIKNYEQAVNFYYHIIINANEASIEQHHQHAEL